MKRRLLTTVAILVVLSTLVFSDDGGTREEIRWIAPHISGRFTTIGMLTGLGVGGGLSFIDGEVLIGAESLGWLAAGGRSAVSLSAGAYIEVPPIPVGIFRPLVIRVGGGIISFPGADRYLYVDIGWRTKTDHGESGYFAFTGFGFPAPDVPSEYTVLDHLWLPMLSVSGATIVD